MVYYENKLIVYINQGGTMELQFKRIEIGNISELMPFYALRHNNTCDSVFLESFIWKEYYHVRYAVW